MNLKKLPIKFQEEGHIHLMEIDGVYREVVGCTSVSGLFMEDSWKFAWPVKLMYEKSMESIKSYFFEDRTDEVIEKCLKEAKGEYKRVFESSADTGRIAHEMIEYNIKTGYLPIDASGEVLNIFNNFKSWEMKANPKWLESELQVGSMKYQYCGILDAICEVDGKIVLIDFKTGGSIKPDYSIQLAGLAICLEEMGLKVDKRSILHLPKDGEYEYKEIKTDLEFEKECFLKGLEFAKVKNLFLSKAKEK